MRAPLKALQLDDPMSFWRYLSAALGALLAVGVVAAASIFQVPDGRQRGGCD